MKLPQLDGSDAVGGLGLVALYVGVTMRFGTSWALMGLGALLLSTYALRELR